jgi:hypothetical protein
VGLEVVEPAAERRDVFLADVRQRHAAVVLERPRRRHDQRRVGPEPRRAALDVEELLGAEICREAGLGQADVAELQRHAGRDDGIAAVGDIGEGTAVHEGRRALQRLDEVRMDGVAEQRGHGARDLELVGQDGSSVGAERHHHAAEPRLQVARILGQAQCRHDLGSGGDEEAALARHAVHAAAESHDHVAERAVVDVQDAPPQHLADVDAERIAVVEVVVQRRGEEVVRGGDRVEVAGEVEVDVLHGHDLGPASAGAAALHAERGSDGRLAQGDDGAGADAGEGLAETDGHGGLAVSRRRRCDRGDDDELAVGLATPSAEGRQQHLGLVAAIRQPFLRRKSQVLGDVSDRSG